MKKLINLPNCQTVMRHERKLTWGRRVPPKIRQINCSLSNIYRKRIRDAALSTFIHHYTFAAKSKSIKYDSRRTIRVGMETIPCTTQ